MALLAAGLCLAFGNVLAVLFEAAGVRYLLIVIALLAATGLLRWIVEKRWGGSVAAGAPFTLLTTIRICFMLALLVALPLLAAAWIAAVLAAPMLQQTLLDALLLTLVGWTIFVTLPLNVIDNGLLAARALARKTVQQ